MHTGHSVYSTLHADTCDQTITRLTNPPIDIPHSMLEAVHLNVVMFRDRRRGIRRIAEIGEFVMNEEKKHEGRIMYGPNIIYKWDAREDDVRANVEPLRLFTELYRHTGLNKQEVIADIEQKKKVLSYMVEHNIRNVQEVGKLMNRYYVEKDTVIDIVENNKDPKLILGEKEPGKKEKPAEKPEVEEKQEKTGEEQEGGEKQETPGEEQESEEKKENAGEEQ
jgi:flagellar protein FlaI